MIKIIADTITPNLHKIRKKLPTTVHKKLKKILKYGKAKAKEYATSDKSGNLRKGIGYRIFKKKGYGYLFSIAEGFSGFPYNLWVNRTVPIIGRYPYFKDGQTIVYGKEGYKSPSSKPIRWTVKAGFFDLAVKDMKKMAKKELPTLWREVLK